MKSYNPVTQPQTSEEPAKPIAPSCRNALDEQFPDPQGWSVEWEGGSLDREMLRRNGHGPALPPTCPATKR